MAMTWQVGGDEMVLMKVSNVVMTWNNEMSMTCSSVTTWSWHRTNIVAAWYWHGVEIWQQKNHDMVMRWSWHGVDMVTTTWCQDGKSTGMTTHMVSTSSWHDDQRVITQQMTWWRNGIWQWTHLCFDWPPADHRKKVQHGQVGNVGRYEGLAPSMWAFPAWFWRMSGTCAIHVPQRQLDVEEKNGCKPAQKIAKNRSFLGTYMARTTCLKMELLHLSPLFSSWHRWRNSIFRAMYFQSGVGDKQSFLRLLEVHSCLVFSCFSYVWCCGCKNVVAIAIVCNISVGVIIDF